MTAIPPARVTAARLRMASRTGSTNVHDVATKVSERIKLGFWMATVWAIIPPREMQIRCTGPASRCSSTPDTVLARLSSVGGVAKLSDSP